MNLHEKDEFIKSANSMGKDSQFGGMAAAPPEYRTSNKVK